MLRFSLKNKDFVVNLSCFFWLQRGTEELLAEGASNSSIKQESNGGTENNNEAKKVKLHSGDNNGGGGGGGGGKPRPSKVVHIRNIPSDVSETEIVHLGIPFGRVSNVLVLKVYILPLFILQNVTSFVYIIVSSSRASSK